MKLTFEKRLLTVRFYMYALPNNGYFKTYMTGILKTICVSNKQVFLEAVLRAKKIKYIASERSYPFRSSWLVLYIYL